MKTQQTQARSQTERKLALIEREILAVYDDARKVINADLQALYAKVLSGVAPDDYYNTVIKYDRLKKLQAQIDSTYIKASVKAGRMTANASAVAMNDAYYKNQFIMSWFSPSVDIALDFTLLPQDLVEMSVTGNLANWQKITDGFGDKKLYAPKEGTLSSILKKNRQEEVLQINRAISSNLIQGNNYTTTARSVRNVIGTTVNGEVTGAMAKAMRIVRTETNRTYNAGAYANSMAVSEQGLDIKRVWVATLDGNTRDRHQSLDGQAVGVDEPFKSGGAEAMYPGGFGIAAQDINCRCTTIDAVNGIPPQARRGVNPNTGEYEIFDWKNYPEWTKANNI